MSDKNMQDDNPATEGVTSEGGVWGVGDPKDDEALAQQTVGDDGAADQDAAFLDVDEADVETSSTPEGDGHPFGNTHGDVEPGTDNQDTTVSQLTDALDSEALASGNAPETDATGSER